MASRIRRVLAFLQLICAAALLTGAHQAFAQNSVTISSVTAQGPLAVTAYSYTAGAVCGVSWNGKQFIDAKDHGRCLQSAASFDWMGQHFNPTEAGASMLADGFLPAPSSSQLINYVANATKLHTQTQMAFWIPVDGQRTSNHVLRKYVQVGYEALANAIDYRVEFEVPPKETHTIGQFEFLTGYMPLEFTSFYAFDPSTGGIHALTDGPGEQRLPVIFATADGSHAMGAWSPDDLAAWGGGYGRWRHFDCVKWNMVARIIHPQGIQRFRAFVVVGSLVQVQATLTELIRTVTVPGGPESRGWGLGWPDCYAPKTDWDDSGAPWTRRRLPICSSREE